MLTRGLGRTSEKAARLPSGMSIRTLTLPKPATLISWGEGTRQNSARFETDGRSTATYLWLDAALFPHVR